VNRYTIKNIFLISFILLCVAISRSQENHENFIKNFTKNILLKDDFSFEDYSKYIRFYNEIDIENNEKLELYLSNVKFMVQHSIVDYIENKDKIRIVDITNNFLVIEEYIFFEDKTKDIKRIFALFEEETFKTAIILDSNGDITSFFSALNKHNNKHLPWFLNEKLK